MSFGQKKDAREPTYGQERDIRSIGMAVDELAAVLRRSRDSANMRKIIHALHVLQDQATVALVSED
jgi:hypothetical protein